MELIEYYIESEKQNGCRVQNGTKFIGYLPLGTFPASPGRTTGVRRAWEKMKIHHSKYGFYGLA